MMRISKRMLLLAAVVSPFVLNLLAPKYLVRGSNWHTIATAFLSLFGIRFVWTCILYPFYFSPLCHLPQPKQTNLILGQLVRLVTEPLGQAHCEWMENIPNDGLIYFRTVFGSENIIITSPKILSEALTLKAYDLIKPPPLAKSLARVIGWGLVLAEGQEHKLQRKNLTPAFSYRHVKNLYPVFWEKSRGMILGIDKELQQRSSSQRIDESKSEHDPVNDGTIQVDGWHSRATLDIIGAASIGKSLDALEDENSKLYQAYKMLFSQDWQTQVIGILNFLLPIWVVRMVPIPRNFKAQKAAQYLRKTCLDLLVEKKRAMAEIKDADVPDLEAGDKDILTVALKSGGFTDNQLVDQLLTFFAAGHETTASTMTWAVYALCKNPGVQKRLREELCASDLPNVRDTNQQITAEQIDQSPYLQAVVNEVLRFYAPVAMTLRVAAKDMELGGQFIPKGTTIQTIPFATSHSPEWWSEDPKVFDPERWLGPGRANTGGAESNYSNMVFSHGPRGCIGASFSKAEFACLLAAWVLAFETTLADPKKVEISLGIRRIKGGLRVKLTPWG